MRIYKILLRSYPNQLRQEFGAELLAVFHQQTLDAYRSEGIAGLSAVWMQVFCELPSTVLAGGLPWSVIAGAGVAVVVSFLEFWIVIAATGIAKLGVM